MYKLSATSVQCQKQGIQGIVIIRFSGNYRRGCMLFLFINHTFDHLKIKFRFEGGGGRGSRTAKTLPVDLSLIAFLGEICPPCSML